METTIRYYNNQNFEVRAAGTSRKVSGYALTFNNLSNDLGGFVEKIDPAALNECDLSNVVALFNHSKDLILARTTAKTLKLSVDSIGLKYEFEAPNTTAGNDLLTSIERQDVTGSSFAFILFAENGDKWETINGVYVRTILKIKRIVDISPVVFPAYSQTDVYKRFSESVQVELRSNPNYSNIKINNMKFEKSDISFLSVVRDIMSGDAKNSKQIQEINERGQHIANRQGLNLPASHLILPMVAESSQIISPNNNTNNNLVFDIPSALQSNLLIRAGATFIPNIIHDFKLPSGNGVRTKWANENIPDSDIISTSGKTFSPKPLSCTVILSKQVLLQNSGNVEAFLKSEIIKALNAKILKTVFGSHATSTNYPDGLYTGLVDGSFAFTGAPTRSKFIDMEFSLTEADRDSRAFFISEKAAKKLKTTRKELDSPFYLLDNGLINDNPVYISRDLPGQLTVSGLEEPVIYANWSELFLVMLGVASFIIDPYSRAMENAVEITIQTYFDFKFRRDSSVARGSISL